MATDENGGRGKLLASALARISVGARIGVAIEIGIEPTVRHGADLGYIPIAVTDACGAGDAEAGERALASVEFMGRHPNRYPDDPNGPWSDHGLTSVSTRARGNHLPLPACARLDGSLH